jgi:hypothetical protein
MENKINRNLLIKVTEEQVDKVLEVLRNNGEKSRRYFGYTENRWCYIGYYNSISEWTIAHDGSIDFGNKEISFEEFIKLTETQETTMENNRKIIMKIDYTIKGTTLPTIPAGTEYRVAVVQPSELEIYKFGFDKAGFVSYGHKWYKDECYILCEREDYENSLYYMVKLSDIEKLTKTQEPMRTIKYSDAQRIVDIACETWKETLFDQWGRKIVLKQDITITEGFYQEMRKNCTEAQHKVFDEIFGEDKPQFKVGDWIVPLSPKKPHIAHGRGNRAYEVYHIETSLVRVYNDQGLKDGNGGIRFNECRFATEEEIKAANVFPDGTPCLVRDEHNGRWMFAYANGKGYFYNCMGKSGMTFNFKYSMKLDMNNLPVNE